VLKLHRIRELTLAKPSAPGRPAHLSAASGLVVVQSLLYVVADDELSIGVFPAAGNAPGELIRFIDGELPNSKKKRKRVKPDLEALVLLPPFKHYKHGALFALGSGSRENRRQGVLFQLDAHARTKGDPRLIDLSPFMAAIENEIGELNIEGALGTQDRFVLLQRGNRGGGINACITMNLADLLHALASGDFMPAIAFDVRRHDLGAIKENPLSFTDGAALPDGRIVFTAVAEDADDAYSDGACLGAVVGVIKSDGTLQSVQRLEPGAKVEGVSARLAGDGIELLLVSDADDATVAAWLYAATLKSRTN